MLLLITLIEDKMVNWIATLSNDELLSGSNEDGSWKNVANYLKDNNLKIKYFRIENQQGTGVIDSNCDGYFLGNKVISTFPFGNSIDLIGIGYWRRNDNCVRILWYSAQSMQLISTEPRELEDCGFFLVKNPL
jgi:hypothetical protein